MNKQTICAMALMGQWLIACSPTEGPEGASALDSTPVTVSHTLYANSGLQANQNGTSNDLTNSLGTVGDTGSMPKRILLTFDLSPLASCVVATAKLVIHYESHTPNGPITFIGQVRAYQIAPTSTLIASQYGATEQLTLGALFTDNQQLTDLSQQDSISLDIKAPLETALSESSNWFTLKIRANNEANGGNSAVLFYVNYGATSGPLTEMRPQLEITCN